MAYTVDQLAAKIGGEVVGDGTITISALSSLGEARRGDISFLSNPRYEHLVATTKASAVVVEVGWSGDWGGRTLIRVTNPDKAVTTIAPLFCCPPPQRQPGVHPTAVVGQRVSLGADVYVGPYVVIEDDVTIGDRTRIEAQSWIGAEVEIGCDGLIYPQVTIREGCIIGDRVILHSGVRVGSDGYGYNIEPMDDGKVRIEKIPQLGIVELGHDVEVGANASIDRARFGRRCRRDRRDDSRPQRTRPRSRLCP